MWYFKTDTRGSVKVKWIVSLCSKVSYGGGGGLIAEEVGPFTRYRNTELWLSLELSQTERLRAKPLPQQKEEVTSQAQDTRALPDTHTHPHTHTHTHKEQVVAAPLPGTWQELLLLLLPRPPLPQRAGPHTHFSTVMDWGARRWRAVTAAERWVCQRAAGFIYQLTVSVCVCV